MISPLKIIGQIAAYTAFAVFIGVFSANPSYTYLGPDQAVVKLSFSHAAKRIGTCRRLTAEEIAALPANMRRTQDCPRERLPLLVELVLNDEVLTHRVLRPAGLHRDGTSAIYQSFVVPAGRHRLIARLRDSDRAQDFDYEQETVVDLVPGQNFVIDFRAESGGFVFR